MTDRITVRDSPVHGLGVFAAAALEIDEHVGFYAGEVIDADEADRRHEADGRPEHTMLFARSDGLVVDGSRGGNATRFLNHGCAPNCHAEEYDDGTIGIVTSGPVAAGAELLIDYQLQVDPEDAGGYPCHCGADACRGSMVASSALSQMNSQ